MGFERLFAEGLGFVLVVRHEERVIAAAVFLTAGDTLFYKYGASDERFLGLRPNNLLFMEAIRWGCEHGKRRLDFGRTDWDHESLRAFKLAWGAEELELQYRHLGGAGPGWRSAKNERVLASIIRRSPPVDGSRARRGALPPCRLTRCAAFRGRCSRTPRREPSPS